MAKFPDALPHGPIEEVFPNVFSVTGGFYPGPAMRITRNMTVVRQGNELVVLNSVRLTADGEKQLERLGTVKHVVRLGSFHGADDPYYAERYAAPVWGTTRMKHSPHVRDVKQLSESDCPVEQGTVHLSASGAHDEAAILLAREGGVLLACDVVQNWTTFDGCSLPAKIFLRATGFGPRCIGPMWMRAMGPGVRPDLDRFAALPFRHVLAAHGTPIHHDGPAALREAVAKRYGA